MARFSAGLCNCLKVSSTSRTGLITYCFAWHLLDQAHAKLGLSSSSCSWQHAYVIRGRASQPNNCVCCRFPTWTQSCRHQTFHACCAHCPMPLPSRRPSLATTAIQHMQTSLSQITRIGVMSTPDSLVSSSLPGPGLLRRPQLLTRVSGSCASSRGTPALSQHLTLQWRILRCSHGPREILL